MGELHRDWLSKTILDSVRLGSGKEIDEDKLKTGMMKAAVVPAKGRNSRIIFRDIWHKLAADCFGSLGNASQALEVTVVTPWQRLRHQLPFGAVAFRVSLEV